MDALIPGSFDPPTLGHLDIIKKAALIFPRVWVAVLHNPSKKTMFSPRERTELLKKDATELTNVSVFYSNEMVVSLAKKLNAVVARGIRGSKDADFELDMASANEDLNPSHLTIFIPSSVSYSRVSSSLAREAALFGAPVDAWLTPRTARALASKVLEL